MARTILSQPFFVFVLSVLTVLMLWQDVGAQERRSHTNIQIREEQPVEPAEPTVDVVAEAAHAAQQPVAVPVAPSPQVEATNPPPAQDKPKATLTLDGETRLIDIDKCQVTKRAATRMTLVMIAGTDGASNVRIWLTDESENPKGPYQEVVLMEDLAKSARESVVVQCLRSRHIKESGGWTSFYEGGEPVPGPLFRIDGSTVTVSGTLISMEQPWNEKHAVEFSVECTAPRVEPIK